jgi:hypothetical protein
MANQLTDLTHASRKRRVNKFPFVPRAQHTGTFRWLCAQCGLVQLVRFTPQKWWVRCTNAYCRRYFVIGTRFLAMGSGCHGPDMVLPPKDHWFPECELGEYSSGGNANEAVEDSDPKCGNDPKP